MNVNGLDVSILTSAMVEKVEASLIVLKEEVGGPLEDYYAKEVANELETLNKVRDTFDLTHYYVKGFELKLDKGVCLVPKFEEKDGTTHELSVAVVSEDSILKVVDTIIDSDGGEVDGVTHLVEMDSAVVYFSLIRDLVAEGVEYAIATELAKEAVINYDSESIYCGDDTDVADGNALHVRASLVCDLVVKGVRYGVAYKIVEAISAVWDVTTAYKG